MITEEEKQEIINKAVERTLLIIPEVVGNMMANHATMNKINTKFYGDNPEFKDHRNIVASVVEMEESKNPGNDYEKLLTDSIEEIRRRISLVKGMDMRKGVTHGDFIRR